MVHNNNRDIRKKSIMRIRILDNRIPKLTTLLLGLLIVWFMTSPALVSAMAGFGGYISEKLLGDGTNEALYLGDGTNELTVLGSGPVVSTLGATSSSAGNIVTMTMTGNLQSLNGMPQAGVWFQWGYSPVMVFNTTQVTASSAGEQTTNINPDAGKNVYYRFIASTDSTTYGAIQSLPVVGGGHGVSYWMLNTLLPIAIAAVILIGVLILTGNPILALVASIVGLAGFYIVLALVSSF